MLSNPVIEAIARRKSIRRYTEEQPTEEVIHTIVRAGQHAPFAAQLGSLLLKRDLEKNPFKAPLLFTVCVDIHRMEAVMSAQGWQRQMSDVGTLLLGIQDAAYMAENMVIAAESLGLGSCYLGATPYYAERIIEEYDLPSKVFPLVQLTMGYPAEDAPVRPRYPLEFTLFEDRYPCFETEQVERAMKTMDEGYLAQDYYRNLNAMIPLSEGREETFSFDDYSWTEHISRKMGQWGKDPNELLTPLAKYGLCVSSEKNAS
ncbi:nitroreductase family protein [Candidatus Bipolaricaulota bacterium]